MPEAAHPQINYTFLLWQPGYSSQAAFDFASGFSPAGRIVVRDLRAQVTMRKNHRVKASYQLSFPTGC